MANWTDFVIAAETTTSDRKGKTASEKVIDNIQRGLTAFRNGNTNKDGEKIKKPLFVQVGDNVRFSVRYANTALKLVDENTILTVPGDKLDAVLDGIVEALKGGKYDAQLKEREAAVKDRVAKMQAKRPAGKKK